MMIMTDSEISLRIIFVQVDMFLEATTEHSKTKQFLKTKKNYPKGRFRVDKKS